MIIDIIKFFFIYTLVLFAFGCGMGYFMLNFFFISINSLTTTFNSKDSINCCGTMLIWRRRNAIIYTAKFRTLIITRKLVEYGDDLLSMIMITPLTLLVPDPV